MKRFLSYVCIVLSTLGVFWLSLQDAPTSNALSQRIANRLASSFLVDFVPAGYSLNSFIRDLAHICVFFVLTLVVMLLLAYLGKSLAYCVSLTLLYVVPISFADELIQYFFSPGRAFEWIDLTKDWVGMYLGMLLFSLCYGIYKLIINKRHM